MAQTKEKTEIVRPPEMPLDRAMPWHGTPAAAFFTPGPESDLWFERRSDVLFVTFDNLATVDEPSPRPPWMGWRVSELGHSILGVQSHRKDWYRHETTGPILRELAERGFFGHFGTVILMGASMGGFAALNFAPLIPGSRVLAFSPQSTMNRTIAPYENRFRYSVRHSNWEGMPFLDAAAAIPYIDRVSILYDPFVPEDKAHVARMRAPHVQLVPLRHCTHEAIRVVVHCDAMHWVMQNFAETGLVGPEFWQRMRHRPMVRKWSRRFVEHISDGRHPKLTIRACQSLLARKPDLRFARLALKAAEEQISLAEGQAHE